MAKYKIIPIYENAAVSIFMEGCPKYIVLNNNTTQAELKILHQLGHEAVEVLPDEPAKSDKK